jgi:hypothetical protein
MAVQDLDSIPLNEEPLRLVPMVDACSLLKCGRNTLKTAANKGHLNLIKRGRCLFFKAADLRAWVDEGMPA